MNRLPACLRQGEGPRRQELQAAAEQPGQGHRSRGEQDPDQEGQGHHQVAEGEGGGTLPHREEPESPIPGLAAAAHKQVRFIEFCYPEV